MRRVLALCAFALALSSSPAWAHISLTSPTSRYGPSVLKTAPCGKQDGMRTTNVTTFHAGETITVKWDEYINHPGHYRIAFDDNGDDDFVDPKCLSDCDTTNMVIETYSNSTVLLDDIADRSTTQADDSYTAQVTLPNITCDNCTLQLIQVMTDKPPYEIYTNDVYHQCADLVLTANPDAGPGDAGADMGVLDMGTPAPDMGTTTPPSDMGTAPAPGDTGSVNSGADASGTGAQHVNATGGCCATVGDSQSGIAGLALLLLAFVGIRRRR